jgi:hypothetical protein
MKTKISRKISPHIFRQISLEQGDAAERYLDDVLQKAMDQEKLPPWFLGWKRHEKWSAGDMAGVDFVITTDRGPIRINVKSSRIFAKQFASRHKHDDIIPIVVNILGRPETFLGNFISIIGKTYKSMSY